MTADAKDNRELAVDMVMAKRNGTYYALNARSTGGQGVVTVKHTLRGPWVCLTCHAADKEDPKEPRHTGCAHTRVTVKHLATEGEPNDGETWRYWTDERGQRHRRVESTALLPV
jgi:hypothetical protein